MSGGAEVRPLRPEDLRWAVQVLAARRAGLVPHAPLLWRPAADADEQHEAFLRRLLEDGREVGVRTVDGLMLAVLGADGWTVDDAFVPPGRWTVDGAALWNALSGPLSGGPVTAVCPTPEPERHRFFLTAGLTLSTSWWHRPTPSIPPAGPVGDPTDPTGGVVRSVSAPPVYDPGGPITFVSEIRDPSVLDRAEAQAHAGGSPLVVVDQPSGDAELAGSLSRRGYVRHCDFFRTPPSGEP